MGRRVDTTEVWTCDLCNGPALPSDQQVAVEVYPGDGRDVGPGFLHGTLYVDIPYGVSRGVACRACKIKFLDIYIQEIKSRSY
jgi:hypothetical protein